MIMGWKKGVMATILPPRKISVLPMDYLIEKHPAKTMAAVLLLGVSALVFLF